MVALEKEAQGEMILMHGYEKPELNISAGFLHRDQELLSNAARHVIERATLKTGQMLFRERG